MKITVSLKRDDGARVPDVIFDSESLLSGFSVFDKAVDNLMALPGQSSQPAASPAFVQPPIPSGKKGPYSPSNPAHPQGGK